MAAITSTSKRRKARPKWVRRVKQAFAIVTIVFLAVSSVLIFLLFREYRTAQDNMESLNEKMDALSTQPTVIVDRNGIVLYRISKENRRVVKLQDVPKSVQNAMLAAEDKRFYEHSGVDIQGIARAMLGLAKEGHVAGGGSTLTMQLAKRLYNGNSQSFMRKIKDVATAAAMEERLTKDQILELYLNQVFFGENAFGIEAASQVYFNKHVQDLTIGESAMLARCVRSPSRENPIRDLKVATENRDVVLGVMQTEGMISHDEYDKAINELPKINPHPFTTTASYPAGSAQYFVNHVLHKIHDDFPNLDLKAGGYRIVTTIDLPLQRTAESVVRQVVKDYRGSHVTTGAFVCMNKEGQILCEVGGVDFNKNQYNVIEQGHRQPGSSFKPLVYATGLATGKIVYGQMLSNAPVHLEGMGDKNKDWNPGNASRTKWGLTIPMETAFKLSINLPAIHVILDTGPDVVANYAKDVFGIQSKIYAYPSLALGTSEVNPLELAEAYSTFMLRGSRVKPYPVARIISPDGSILKSYSGEITATSLDPQVCDEIDHLTRAVVESGTGTRAQIVPNAHGKTGTTQETKDAWFCGYTDGLVGIGWIANEQARKNGPPAYRPMKNGIFGGTVTVQIWAGVMKVAHEKFADKEFEARNEAARHPVKPEGTVPPLHDVDPDGMPIDPDGTFAPPAAPGKPSTRGPDANPATTGGDPTTGTTPPITPPPDTTPPPVRQNHDEEQGIEVEVCADTGLLATPYCPETVFRKYHKGQEPKRKCRLHSG